MRRIQPTSTLILCAMLLQACQPEDAGPSTPTQAAEAEVRPRHLIVRPADPLLPGPSQSLLRARGARRLRPLPGGAELWELPEGADLDEAIAALQRSGRFELVEPDALRRVQASVNDPRRGEQWGLDRLDAEAAWDLATGEGVIVAVVDTGVSTGGLDGLNHVLPGRDFVNGDDDADDDHGHGTHVAGTIAQTADDGVGVAGLAHGVSILPVKVCDASGMCANSDIMDGIQWAVDQGADVINISLGGRTPSAAEARVLREATETGVVIVAAAGNNYGSTVSFPAAYRSVIAVGATDRDDGLAEFSNFGDDLDLVAPGVEILQETLVGANTFDWEAWDGTSMAAPHVAACAALLVEQGASGPEVRRMLQETAFDAGTGGWDPRFGHGLVQPAAALEAWRWLRDGSQPLVGDVDGDGRDDLIMVDAGVWSARDIDGVELFSGLSLGEVGQQPLLGDLDGDGVDDLLHRSGRQLSARDRQGQPLRPDITLATREDALLFADFDGDGVDEVAHRSQRRDAWFVVALDGRVLASDLPWGGPGSRPLVGDFDGDGLADIAVFGPATATWSARSLTRGPLTLDVPLGAPGCEPVVGDLDGDGADDIACWDPATGTWEAATADGRPLASGLTRGAEGDVPALGDLDGDGRAELITYSPDDGLWQAMDLTGQPLVVDLALGRAL